MGESRRQLSTIFLIVFIDLVGFGMVIPFVPLWAERYQPRAVTLALLLACYSTMQFLAAPLLGRLSDRFGRRPVLLLSLLGSVLGYLLLAVAGSLPLLFASRIIDGLSGGNIATAQAVIADTTKPEERARGMGIIGAAFGLGFIFGPAIGGLLMPIRSWLPAVAAAATSATAFVMVWFLLPETRPVGGQPAAPAGLLGLTRLRTVIARPELSRLLAMVFLNVIAFSAFEMTFALFMHDRHHLSERTIGLLLAGVGVTAAVIQGGLIGRLSRRFGEERLLLVGSSLGVVGLGALPYMPNVSTLLLPIAVLAVGSALFNPSLSALTSRHAGGHEMGEVLGVFQSLSSLGRVVGPLVGGLLFKAIGDAWPYRVGALLTLIVVALAASLPPRARASAVAPA